MATVIIGTVDDAIVTGIESTMQNYKAGMIAIADRCEDDWELVYEDEVRKWEQTICEHLMDYGLMSFLNEVIYSRSGEEDVTR